VVEIIVYYPTDQKAIGAETIAFFICGEPVKLLSKQLQAQVSFPENQRFTYAETTSAVNSFNIFSSHQLQDRQ
jgi:hypothetical protein